MGSWKIIETSLPLILRISFSLIFFDLMTVEIYRTADELAGIGGKTHY